jgi:hypothetical protein
MCITAVVKCWHCGEWFAKQANGGEFEDCPFCGKGFEQLGVEAQRAVKATLAPFFEVPHLKERPLSA